MQLTCSVTAGFMNLQFPAMKLIARNVLSARMISQAKNCSALLIIAINVQLKLDTLILLSSVHVLNGDQSPVIAEIAIISTGRTDTNSIISAARVRVKVSV